MSSPQTTGDPCPCGTGRTYDDCCGPLIAPERLAATAEELMRSRYTAHVHGHAEHLWRTWHPRTRPPQVEPDRDVRWTGLVVHAVRAGGPDDTTGTVEFTASHAGGELHEASRFERRGGRWLYLDAEGDGSA